MHACMHTTLVCIHTRTHAHTYTCIHTCAYVNTQTHKRTLTLARTHTHTHVNTHAHTHTNTQTHAQANAHTHTHAYAQTTTHTHVHTHTGGQKRSTTSTKWPTTYISPFTSLIHAMTATPRGLFSRNKKKGIGNDLYLYFCSLKKLF